MSDDFNSIINPQAVPPSTEPSATHRRRTRDTGRPRRAENRRTTARAHDPEPTPERHSRHSHKATGRRGGPRPVRRESTGLRLLDMSLGIVILLVVACLMQLSWMYIGHDLDSIHTQEIVAKTSGFDDKTTAHADTTRIAQPQSGDAPVDGNPQDTQFIGWMYIPKLGDDWKRAIQQGAEGKVLDNMGLGHYPQTVMPGGKGNTAYAGHRAPGDLGYADRLEAGDPIVIQTNDHWYVYQVTGRWLTTKEHVEVLDSEEGKQWLTLTTCDPMFATEDVPDRMIVRAQFMYWANVGDGMPKELVKDTGSPARSVRATVSRTVRDVSKRAPMSIVLFGVSAVFWLLFLGVCWLLWHRDRERRSPSWNVMVALWRLQCGPLVLRVLSAGFMWAALLFAEWAWFAPVFAGWLAVLQPWWDGLRASMPF